MFMINRGYLKTNSKFECVGCKACYQICPKKAILFSEDKEGFLYPRVDNALCINCNLCHKVCPVENTLSFYKPIYCYGGYNKNKVIRQDSTSGGIFSLLSESAIKNGFSVYGAECNVLDVKHSEAKSIEELKKFRKSKYSQSDIDICYISVKNHLVKDEKVLFSGTPCQIAGLFSFLSGVNLNNKLNNLVTVEVLCQSVPSPLFLRKYRSYMENKYKATLVEYVYRNKSSKTKDNKWDYLVEKATFERNNKRKIIYIDRLFNPFYNVWLRNFMSRPSCYQCQFTRLERVADITLGDLWGVTNNWPELYGDNLGVSLVLCNTEKGLFLLNSVKENLFGHEIPLEVAIKYQQPLVKSITLPKERESFMNDLSSDMLYNQLVRKWFRKPSLKSIIKRYIFSYSRQNRKLLRKQRRNRNDLR